MGWNKEAKDAFKAHLTCGTCKHLRFDDENRRSSLMRTCEKLVELRESITDVWVNQDWDPTCMCEYYEDCPNVEQRIVDLCSWQ